MIYNIHNIYDVLHFPTLVLSRSGAKGQDYPFSAEHAGSPSASLIMQFFNY